MLSILPGNVYWVDIHNVYQGCNQQQAIAFMLKSPKDIVGRKNIELPCFGDHLEMAKIIDNNNLKVFKSSTVEVFEETYFDENGSAVNCISKKMPIYDDSGNVIGLIAIVTEIAKKESFLPVTKKEYTKADLQNIIQHMPEYVALKDADGRYVACNEAHAHYLGFQSGGELIGKTDFDLPTQKLNADECRRSDVMLMNKGSATMFEETLSVNGKEIKVISQKIPLKDRSQKSIGIMNIAIDITETRKLEEEVWLLEHIIGSVPGHVWWKDKDCRFLGCNDQQAIDVGFNSKYMIKNKMAYDIITKNQPEEERIRQAKLIDDVDKKVLTTEEGVTLEESVVLPDGKQEVWLSKKDPLYDKTGNIVGLIGLSVNITDKKEKEDLKLENEKLEIDNKMHKAVAAVQEEFRTSVGQMVHDIRTPLSTLQMTVQSTREIPEEKRIALRDAAITISDITSQLLRQYEPEENKVNGEEERQMLLVSTALANIISDRRYKYKDLPIKFEYEMNQLNAFIFIKVEPGDFKRAISNMINNAVESLSDAGGTVVLKLRSGHEWVKILIDDDGKGIPKKILDKINNREAVTYGKKHGHGLGLTVVRDMVERNNGEFEIHSCTGEKENGDDSGTVMELRFPCIITPDWIAKEITLMKDDIIVILDDDTSIHGGWDSRLNHILEKVPTISVKHFTAGSDFFDFIDNLSKKDKERVLLLSDYELIGQKLNGLEIIAKSKIKRSILVTSHYANVEVRKTAMQNTVKILPKDLVHIVPIKVTQVKTKDELVNVHMVFVDDLACFTRDLIVNYYGHLIIDSYTNPMEFLDEVDKYPKDTKFMLDNLYNMEDGTLYPIDGVEIAKQLHEKGYTKLFLLSGESFSTPNYLKLILKTDQESLSKLDQL